VVVGVRAALAGKAGAPGEALPIQAGDTLFFPARITG